MKKTIGILSLVFLLFALAPTASAQCAMCKMSPQSNLDNGGSAGRGLNGGILYMLAMPYLLVGSLGLVWYLNRRKETSTEQNTEN